MSRRVVPYKEYLAAGTTSLLSRVARRVLSRQPSRTQFEKLQCRSTWGNGREEGRGYGERIGGHASAATAGGLRGGHAQGGAFGLGALARGREGAGLERPGQGPRRSERAHEHGARPPGGGRCGGVVSHQRTLQAHIQGREQGRGRVKLHDSTLSDL